MSKSEKKHAESSIDSVTDREVDKGLKENDAAASSGLDDDECDTAQIESTDRPGSASHGLRDELAQSSDDLEQVESGGNTLKAIDASRDEEQGGVDGRERKESDVSSTPSTAAVEIVECEKTASRSVSMKLDRFRAFPTKPIQTLMRSLSGSDIHRRQSREQRTESLTLTSPESITDDGGLACGVDSGTEAVLQPVLEEAAMQPMANAPLANSLAIEYAEKALGRYFSPSIPRRDLRLIVESEKALEQELMGLNQALINRMPIAFKDQLNKRARAMAAAESVATRHPFTPRRFRNPQLSNTKAIITGTLSSSSERSVGESPLVNSLSYSEKKTSTGDVVESTHIIKHPSQLSKKGKSCKHGDLADPTAVYDRTKSWRNRHDLEIEHAQQQKYAEVMDECSFQPNRRLNHTPTDTESKKTEQAAEAAKKTDEACRRLYQAGIEHYAKQNLNIERRHFKFQQEMQSAMPRPRSVPSNIYGIANPRSKPDPRGGAKKLRPVLTGISGQAYQRSNDDSVGMDQCTFHPKTNVKRTWSIPHNRKHKSFWDWAKSRVSDSTLADTGTTSLNSEQLTKELNEVICTGDGEKKPPIDFFSLEGRPECPSRTEQMAEIGPGFDEGIPLQEIKAHSSDTGKIFLGHRESIEGETNDFTEPLNLGQNSDDSSVEESHSLSEWQLNSIDEECSLDYMATHTGPLPKSAERFCLTRYAGNDCLMADIDFADFLQRQEKYTQDKDAKIRALAKSQKSTVELAPGTKRILKEKRAQLLAAKSDAEGRVHYLSTTASNEWDPTTDYSRRSHRRQARLPFNRECSFKPWITVKARKLRRRTLEELINGSSKTHHLHEARKTDHELRELMELTFKPKLNKNTRVPSRLNLRNPEAYMATIYKKQQQKHLREIEAAEAKEAAEMVECTFHPKTSPMLETVKRKLDHHHHRSTQSQKQSQLSFPERGYYALKFEAERRSS